MILFWQNTKCPQTNLKYSLGQRSSTKYSNFVRSWGLLSRPCQEHQERDKLLLCRTEKEDLHSIAQAHSQYWHHLSEMFGISLIKVPFVGRLWLHQTLLCNQWKVTFPWIMQYQSPGTGLIMCPGKFVFTNASAISRERAIRSGSVLETRIGMYSNQNDNRGLFYIIQTIIYKMYNVLAYC